VVQGPAARAITLFTAARTQRAQEFVRVTFRHRPNLSVWRCTDHHPR
jgi:hypothetical protein